MNNKYTLVNNSMIILQNILEYLLKEAILKNHVSVANVLYVDSSLWHSVLEKYSFEGRKKYFLRIFVETIYLYFQVGHIP